MNITTRQNAATAGFLRRSPGFFHTVKSGTFGATRNSDAKLVKCVHSQIVSLNVLLGETCKKLAPQIPKMIIDLHYITETTQLKK